MTSISPMSHPYFFVRFRSPGFRVSLVVSFPFDFFDVDLRNLLAEFDILWLFRWNKLKISISYVTELNKSISLAPRLHSPTESLRRKIPLIPPTSPKLTLLLGTCAHTGPSMFIKMHSVHPIHTSTNCDLLVLQLARASHICNCNLCPRQLCQSTTIQTSRKP